MTYNGGELLCLTRRHTGLGWTYRHGDRSRWATAGVNRQPFETHIPARIADSYKKSITTAGGRDPADRARGCVQGQSGRQMSGADRELVRGSTAAHCQQHLIIVGYAGRG